MTEMLLALEADDAVNDIDHNSLKTQIQFLGHSF